MQEYSSLHQGAAEIQTTIGKRHASYDMLMNNSSAHPVTSRIVTIPTHIAASSGTLIPERNLSHAKGNVDHQSQSQAHIVNAAIMQLNR